MPEQYEVDTVVTETLNSLYADLSEDNKKVFDDLIQSEQGVYDLIDFAKEQGY